MNSADLHLQRLRPTAHSLVRFPVAGPQAERYPLCTLIGRKGANYEHPRYESAVDRCANESRVVAAPTPGRDRSAPKASLQPPRYSRPLPPTSTETTPSASA